MTQHGKATEMGLTGEDLAGLQMALVQKRCEILGSVTGIEASLRPNEPAETSASALDIGNVGTADYDIENTALLLENERKIIAEIDDCLRAMAEGRYGTCSQCGNPIPAERLKAIPWTSRCVVCAAEAERARASLWPLRENDDYEADR